MGTASFALMKPLPLSDSWTKDITASITFELTRMGALRGGDRSAEVMGSFGLSDRKKKPLLRERALDLFKYEASE